jgi:Golgi phosphoprotein 3
MLTLTQELLLLALREKKKTVELPGSSALPYALAGAMLVELVLAGKIQLEGNRKVVPVMVSQPDETPQPVENQRLNELADLIRRTPKPRKASYWILTTVRKAKKLVKNLLEELIASGVLKEEEKKVLWVIPYTYTAYSQQDASAKYQRKQRLRDIVLGGQPVDPQSVALLSLMKAADLLDHLFTSDEMKAASSRVGEIVKDEAIGKAVIETLDTISFATLAAISASTGLI